LIAQVAVRVGEVSDTGVVAASGVGTGLPDRLGYLAWFLSSGHVGACRRPGRVSGVLPGHGELDQGRDAGWPRDRGKDMAETGRWRGWRRARQAPHPALTRWSRSSTGEGD